jgi:hypothetical protein
VSVLSTDLLRLFAKLRPEIWEVIGGGPQGWGISRLPQDPQPWRQRPATSPVPDPWRQGPHPEPWRLGLQLSSVQLTQRIAETAALMATQGTDPRSFIKQVVDDWCGTKVPSKPFPPKWPIPKWGNNPDGLANEDVALVFAAASASFASLAGDVEDENIRSALDEAADVTAEQAVTVTR